MTAPAPTAYDTPHNRALLKMASDMLRQAGQDLPRRWAINPDFDRGIGGYSPGARPLVELLKNTAARIDQDLATPQIDPPQMAGLLWQASEALRWMSKRQHRKLPPPTVAALLADHCIEAGGRLIPPTGGSSVKPPPAKTAPAKPVTPPPGVKR